MDESRPVTSSRVQRDPGRPVYVISVAASIVSVHPRTLRIYEDEGLVCPARTPSNNRLYSEDDIRRVLWIRHLTRDRGVNLAGIRLLFELEERLGARILEALFDEGMADRAEAAKTNASESDASEHAKPLTSMMDGAAASSDTHPATRTPAATPRRP